MRNSKLLLKHVVFPTSQMFVLFLLRLQQKILHRMSLHWNRGQQHVLIQQFSGFCKSSMSSCMIWLQHSRLHRSCAPWQCSGCDLRQPPCRLSATSRIIDGLIAELPDYVAAARDVVVTTEEQKVKWWCQHVERLPRWSAAVKQVLLVQPSSAAVERAFSILSAAFSDQQDSALADYLQASVML